MQLVRNVRWERWEALTKWGEGDAPKAAGFLWDREAKRWHTTEARVADKLRTFADEATKALLDAALAAEPEPVPAAPQPPVRLSFSEARGRWEAVASCWEAGDLPKAAGFRWESTARLWHTTDVLKAAKLRAYAADEATGARLDAEAAAAQAEADAAAERARQAVEASRATDADIEIPCAPGRAFLPYQRAGIAFGLARPSVLIGDDMGLGKTAQAIGITNADESLRRILVVCPASLTRNWQREFGFFGSRGLSVGIASTKALPETEVVIVTYDVFSRKTAAAEAIRAQEWDALILDEAHYCKNRDAARTRAILGGLDAKKRAVEGIRARRRIYLTGTPVTNRPVELWPLVHSLAPAEFPDFWAFARSYCDARNTGYGWDFSGASNLVELQDRLRATVMVRRLKKDVLAELPPKRRQIIELPADSDDVRDALKAEEDAEAGNATREAAIAELRARVELAKASAQFGDYRRAVAALREGEAVPFTDMSLVRHRTAVAKAPMVAEHVRDAVEAGAKVIVFAHHKDVVDLLREKLQGLGVVVVTGDTPPAKRQDAVDAFQARDNIRVFIGNIQAAGVGLTLTASAHVVFAELDWVPGNLSQAEDRAHRLGQRNAVLVQHLVLEGSLDARMAATVTAKQGVIDAALDGVEAPAERERRIAEAQVRMDADVSAAEAALRDRAVPAPEAGNPALAAALARIAARDEAAIERAATAALTPEEVAAAAAALTPAQVAAIHEGLRILSDRDLDGARDRNGVGFSKVDTYVGQTLARQGELTSRQAVLGLTLVRRYRRQLPGELLAAALGLEAPAPAEAASEQPAAAGPVTEAPAEAPQAGPEISTASVAAVHECLRLLAAAEGVDEPTARFVGAIAAKAELPPHQALVCRRLVDRHRPLLPADLAAVAMGEAEPVPAAAPAPVAPGAAPAAAEPVAPAEEAAGNVVELAAAPRRRGRPPKNGTAAMTKAERNRASRAARKVVTVEMPADVAERLRALREATGASAGELLQQALDIIAAGGQRAA